MKKFKGSLPNILTFINMSLGVMSILVAVNLTRGINSLITASLLIMIAALTDRFDGKVARMLDVESELGKELDSLSDLISFGVAPVIIAWKVSMVSTLPVNLAGLGIVGYLLILIFPIAGAYRLARYNVTEFNNVFMGMPITVAGAFLAIDNIINALAIKDNRYSNTYFIVTILLIVFLSYFMISKIKIRKM